MHFWHFAPIHDAGVILRGSYDPGIVALSLLVAVLGAWAALSVVSRLRLLTSRRARRAWLAAGSFAMGSGIWAMHFTGMLAFDLPRPVTFERWLTLASILPAILGSAIALRAIDKASQRRRSVQPSAIAFAAAIAVMHFVGMEAMQVEGATMAYDPGLFLLSVAVAYGLSLTALQIRSFVEGSTASTMRIGARHWTQPIAALVMGCAVAGMHYTAMAAATFAADPTALPVDAYVSRTSMALAIVVVGSAIAFLTILGTIVDRKLREASVRLAEHTLQHRVVTDRIRDGLIVVAGSGQVQSSNPAAQRIFGYSSDELAGMQVERILPIAAQGLDSCLDANADVDGLRKNGSLVSLSVTGHSTRIGRAAATTLIVRASDEVEALERRLRRLAAAIEYTEEAIAIVDVDLRIVYVNPGYIRHFKGNEHRLLGHDASAALGIEPDSESYQNIKEALGRTKIWQGRLVSTDREGRAHQVDVSISPVRNEINLVTNFVIFFHDMTEKLMFERQLHQAQRLESIGQLASGVAHEINTPAQFVADNIRFLSKNFAAMLKGLQAYRDLLRPESGPMSWEERRARLGSLEQSLDVDFVCEEIPRALAEAEEGVTRIASIVGAMKEFSHAGSGNLEPADVNAAIRSTVTVCRNRWKYVADLELDLADDLPLVPCHITDLNQVFLNLIVNAADAIAETAEKGAKGRITVSTRVVGNQVEVAVRDNGPGIPEALAPKIFEPFFTTKGVGKGTGQGLAISRDTVVNKHRGALTFDSLPGVATTFRVRIPFERGARAELRAS